MDNEPDARPDAQPEDLPNEPPAARRFPHTVYRVGTEPDPRNTLANERTMLAWVRTSLGLLASGVALLALSVPVQGQLRFLAALILIAAGIGGAWHAWRGWVLTQRALRLGADLPSPWIGMVLALLVGCAGILVLAGLLIHAASI